MCILQLSSTYERISADNTQVDFYFLCMCFRYSFRKHVPKSVFGLDATTSFVSTVRLDVHKDLNNEGRGICNHIQTNTYIYLYVYTAEILTQMSPPKKDSLNSGCGFTDSPQRPQIL